MAATQGAAAPGGASGAYGAGALLWLGCFGGWGALDVSRQGSCPLDGHCRRPGAAALSAVAFVNNFCFEPRAPDMKIIQTEITDNVTYKQG